MRPRASDHGIVVDVYVHTTEITVLKMLRRGGYNVPVHQPRVAVGGNAISGEEGRMAGGRDFTNGVVLGAAVGTFLGVLFAPEEGAALRDRLQGALGGCDILTAVRRAFAAAGDVKAGVELGMETSSIGPAVQLGVESASARLRGAPDDETPR